MKTARSKFTTMQQICKLIPAYLVTKTVKSDFSCQLEIVEDGVMIGK